MLLLLLMVSPEEGIGGCGGRRGERVPRASAGGGGGSGGLHDGGALLGRSGLGYGRRCRRVLPHAIGRRRQRGKRLYTSGSNVGLTWENTAISQCKYLL